MPRRNPRRRGGGLNLLMLNLPALLTNAGIELPVPFVDKATRPVVHVNAARRRRRRVLLGLEQPRVRLAEVIVVEAVNPRRHAVLQRPLADALFIRTAAGRRLVVRNNLIAAERLVLRGGVGEHQGVLVRLMAEVIRNPLQLHQTADEVQARLLILHAVVPHPVAAGEFVLNVDLMLTQQGFHNLRHRLALENTQVTVALHRPQVRLHRQLVHRIAGARQLNGADRHPGNLAVYIAGRQQALRRDGHRDRLAQQLTAVNARVRAEHGQRQRERLGHRLAARQFPEQKPLHRELNGNSVEHNLYSI